MTNRLGKLTKRVEHLEEVNSDLQRKLDALLGAMRMLNPLMAAMVDADTLAARPAAQPENPTGDTIGERARDAKS